MKLNLIDTTHSTFEKINNFRVCVSNRFKMVIFKSQRIKKKTRTL